MPQIEINSPLTNTQVETGFHVTGWTDQVGATVTCVVSGAAGTQTLAAVSDASGNWDSGATTVPVGTDYSVTATITVSAETFSDGNEGIEVRNPVTSPTTPIQLTIDAIGVTVAGKRGLRTATISGRYSTATPPARILVTVVVVRRKKVRVYSADTVDAPTGGTWAVTLPAPSGSARRSAVLAVGLDATKRTISQTSRRA